MVAAVAVVGPTAVGKSALALELALRLEGEIVNADALQVYRGFDLGTAKPSPGDRRRVPHHLIDILDPRERFSAGEFARRARAAIDEIGARERLPILVGGSGLYLRALLQGISSVPPANPALRAHLRRRLATEGLSGLRAELEVLDPGTAGRLTSADSQRTLRALEVALGSGRRLSEWIERQPFGTRPLSAVRVGLTVPRALLYDRIAARVRSMIAAGWLQEVEGLLRRGVEPEHPAFQAIGYRELAACLRGERSLEDALEETIRATRRFAKRQETWFRREPDVTWFTATDFDHCLREILHFLRTDGGGESHDESKHQHPGRLSLP